MNREVMSVF